MKKFYGTEIPGSLSPVPATPEMTQPVGVRDGQLFVDPGDVGELTDRVEALEQTTETLEDNVSELQTDVGEAQSDIETLETGVSSLNGRMNAAESNIGTNAQEIGQLQFDVSQAQTDIVGLGLSKLDKPTNEGDTGDVIVKTANGTEYQPVAPFNPNGTYPNVTTGKAISAKSLENVSEDSGATQTEPFFFQATATANNTEETPTAPVFNLKSIRGNTIVYNQLVDGVSTTYPTISGHVYWFKHDPLVSLVTSAGTDINVPTPQSDKLVDLTRWFNGSIPQAILDDATIFPINYYDGELTYSVGELKNSSCTEFKTIGFNAWDEEWERGTFNSNDGTKQTDLNRIRSKNYIRVIPNAIYYIKAPMGIQAYFYDAQKNYIGIEFYGNNRTRQIASNVCYIMFSMGNSATPVTTYGNDITINLSWDGERNGEYAPYVSHTYPLVWSGKSAGSVYDEKLPDGTETEKIDDVDLGSLDWTLYGETTDSFYATIPTMKSVSETAERTDGLICSGFVVDSSNSFSAGSWGDKTIKRNSNKIYLKNSDFSGYTTAQVKSALFGTILYFELATPTTAEETAYTSEIEGDDYGTMSFDSVVPVGNEFFYPADYSLLIDDLGNYTGYDVTKLMLKTDNVVPSAPTSDGTYVLKCVVSGGNPTYSWIDET